MEKSVSLVDVYRKYQPNKDGKTVTNSSKIQEVLRNKIQSELSYSSFQPLKHDKQTSMQTKQQPQESKAIQHAQFYSQQHIPFSVELTGSTMQCMPSSIYSSPTVVSEAFQERFIHLCFITGQGVVTKEIPMNSTVLQLRHYLMLEKVVPNRSLDDWRLLFDNEVLDDDASIHSLSLPQGALLTTIAVPADKKIVYAAPEVDVQNAATFPPRIQADGKTSILVRTIDGSKQSPLRPQPTLSIPTDGVSKPVESIPVGSVPIEVDDYFPILRRPGYYMIPSHFDMQRMSKEDVAHIQNFTVGNEGAGEIIWEGETDACYLNLDDRVIVDRDLNGSPFVQVYPPQSYLKAMPMCGMELNKAATVRLFNLFPKGLRSQDGLLRFEALLRKQVNQMNGEWIDYDRNRGILMFKVPHFLIVCSDSKENSFQNETGETFRIRFVLWGNSNF